MKRDLYLALGDSVTAGYGATNPMLGFAQYVSRFTRQHGLCRQTLLVAKNGWTSRDIWNAARMVHPEAWKRTHVLTLMAGGNDLRKLLRRQFLSLSGAPLTDAMVDERLLEFGFYMRQICQFVAHQEIPHVVVANVYNPVPHSPLGVRAIEGLNVIMKEITQHYKLPVVDVYGGFLNREADYIENYRLGRFEDLLSPIRRPIHPNNHGHKEIADCITAELQRRTTEQKRKKTAARAAKLS